MELTLILTIAVLLTLVSHHPIDSTETQSEILRGVTIRNWPYADRLSGKFEGYVVDIMNEIADTVGFDYRLYFSPDGKYGAVEDNRINGMIGEVFNNRADFAIADIAVTDVRKKYVDFTEPFIETGISILIHKNNSRNIRSFRDLADQTEIKYGTYRMGSTSQHFSQSSDPVIRKMYNQMLREPDVFVSNAKEGVDRVNSSKYAFLIEGTFAEFLSGMYCDLTYIDDRTNYFPRSFAIATAKGSMYTEKFSATINKMKRSGQLDKIKARYWKNRCANSGNNRVTTNSRDRPTIKWADKGYDVSAGFSSTFYSNLINLSIISTVYYIYCCFE